MAGTLQLSHEGKMRIIRANVRPGISWGEMAREMSCLATVDVVRQCSSLPWNGSWPAVQRRAADQRHLHGHRNDHLRGANVRLSAVCRVPLRTSHSLRGISWKSQLIDGHCPAGIRAAQKEFLASFLDGASLYGNGQHPSSARAQSPSQ